jgi:hypothetical protein
MPQSASKQRRAALEAKMEAGSAVASGAVRSAVACSQQAHSVAASVAAAMAALQRSMATGGAARAGCAGDGMPPRAVRNKCQKMNLFFGGIRHVVSRLEPQGAKSRCFNSTGLGGRERERERERWGGRW